MRKWLAFVPALLLTLTGSSTRATAGAAAVTFDETVQPFLAEHCYGCHNASKAKGNLNLKRFEDAGAVAADPNAWERILARLRTGEMPPEDEPRPAPAALADVTAWIDRAIAGADAEAPPDPGRVTIRRLNRTEYNNSVRDLLAVTLTPADEFPQDDTGYGFDNIGEVLSVSPLLMERYMVAAERVARAAIVGAGPVQATLLRCQPKSRSVQPSPEVPSSYDATGLALPNAVHVTRRLPETGTYRVRVYTGGARPAGSEPLHVALWIDGQQVAAQALDPTGEAGFFSDKQDFAGKFREFTARIQAGEHWIAASIPALFEGLPPSYHGPRPSARPEPPPPVFAPPADATPERVERLRKAFDEEHAQPVPANDARVSYFEIAGPYDVEGGPSPETRRRLYTCGHLHGGHTRACARTILTSLARRAYRRPVGPADLDPLLGLVASSRAKGEPFEEGLAVALQAILVSPDFLFRLEGGFAAPRSRDDGLAAPKPRSGEGEPEALSDHELATRLSYFLWSSMPDRRLRRLADQGVLRQPAVLETEVRRLLHDPRARALVEEFGGQWLQLRALESAAPDRDRFPAFDDYLRLSMRRETELFFERIVREDRSILEFLDAPWTFLNERLARHYGIPGVSGPVFREVALTSVPRAGVLTQASVLTVSSYATRTSPVLRGKWILENLLDAAPPAPPPGVANLNEATAATPTSLRQQLEAHRTNATCAACHRRMDPLGFGLENYDAIGRWRDKDGDSAIDASGTLPDGRTFSDPAGLRSILASEREAFTKALASKMLTWAVGRGLEPGDRRIIRGIARELPAKEYRFSALVLAIVRSPAFSMRRGATP